MTGIMPNESSGGVVVRDEDGTCLGPTNVTNAYCPGPGFASTCAITALPNDCSARVTAAQVNAIVSELLALGETFDPDGTWRCSATNNLASLFQNWALTVASGAEALEVAQQALETAQRAETKADTVIAQSAADRQATEEAAQQAADDLVAMEVLVDGLTGTVTTVEQNEDGTWPPRPDGYLSVHFFGETFPTGLMTSRRDSFWLRQKKDKPSPPGAGDWAPVNMHDGVNGGIIIYDTPEVYPPITGAEYSVNGGPYTALPDFAPGLYPVAMPAGDNEVTLRWENDAGVSIDSNPQSVTIANVSFLDDFERADENLSDGPNWTDLSISTNSTRMRIVSGNAQPGTTNAVNAVIAEQYFMPNMRVEGIVLGAGNNTADFRGVNLLARATRVVDDPLVSSSFGANAYVARTTNSTWSLHRVKNGVRTLLTSGNRAWVAGHKLAIEVKTVSGNVEIKLFDNDVQFGTTFTDSTADKILTGNQGGYQANASGSEGSGAVRISQFEVKAVA